MVSRKVQVVRSDNKSLYKNLDKKSNNNGTVDEHRKTTLATPGISTHLMKSHCISIAIMDHSNEDLRKYNYTLL